MADKNTPGKSSRRVRAARPAAAESESRGGSKSSAGQSGKKGKPGPGKSAARATPQAPVARSARAEAPKAAVRKTPSPRGAAASKAKPRATVSKPATREEALPPLAPGLSEEDAIRSAKYLPRDLPPRLFEEERFLFPESYGVDRVRLLVRDPEWLFAYWDVNPKSVEALKRSVGERAAAVARLTLRISDPVSGGTSDVLLPPGARWWYVRTDSARRSYRAELGFTLASGEFRRLAASNTVTAPRVGPSAQRATRRLSYKQAEEISPEAASAAGAEERRTGSARAPWKGTHVDAASSPEPPTSSRGEFGGASDTFRPGGASDTHRR
jgi:hypothetical protein